MKTVLWAALTANGNYARNSAEHPPKPEALADFGTQVRRTKNFVVGRKTFESFAAGATGPNAVSGTDIVVITSTDLTIPGIMTARSPQEALSLLSARGHSSILLAGGEALHNSFLSEGLVDEIIFVMTPVLEDRGMKIVLNDGQFVEVRLVEAKELGNGVVRMHYAMGG